MIVKFDLQTNKPEVIRENFLKIAKILATLTSGGGGVPTLHQILTEGGNTSSAWIGFTTEDEAHGLMQITPYGTGNVGYNILMQEYPADKILNLEPGTIQIGFHDGAVAIKSENITANRALQLPNYSGEILAATDLVDIGAITTIVGFSSFTAGKQAIVVQRSGNFMDIVIDLEGPSNNALTSIIVPYTGYSGVAVQKEEIASLNNGTSDTGYMRMTAGSNVVNIYRNAAGSNWANTGTKGCTGSGRFLINNP